MSASLGAWKQAVARAAHVVLPEASGRNSGYEELEETAQLECLVRELFLGPLAALKEVFFVAAESETNVANICERVATILARLSGSTVAVVEAGFSGPAEMCSQSHADAEITRKTLFAGPGRVWRLSPQEFLERLGRRDGTSKAAFDYVLFAATVSDSLAPVFSRESDGAVLVVTANRTRREAALHAKQLLSQWNAELLGVVLDQRKFPIPEAIYRRL
ncbi:MAG TPA: hypothetical protein VF447_02630 [Terriglobales bacterium]